MKSKQEVVRMKKKLEADINEMELALDHANRSCNALSSSSCFLSGFRSITLYVDGDLNRMMVWLHYNVV